MFKRHFLILLGLLLTLSLSQYICVQIIPVTPEQISHHTVMSADKKFLYVNIGLSNGTTLIYGLVNSQYKLVQKIDQGFPFGFTASSNGSVFTTQGFVYTLTG